MADSRKTSQTLAMQLSSRLVLCCTNKKKSIPPCRARGQGGGTKDLPEESAT